MSTFRFYEESASFAHRSVHFATYQTGSMGGSLSSEEVLVDDPVSSKVEKLEDMLKDKEEE